jgi:oligopeptide transport system ATP-binding protein
VLKAVDDLNFNLAPGETLGIVGESGCGKSTLARALIGLVPITGGVVRYQGEDLARAGAADWRRLRREIQFVFQDPLASLNPRMSIGEIVAEPLLALYPELSKAERERRAMALLERVGLSPAQRNRYPHEFSGGQCQRVGIARALVVQPKLLICDEPVSALDVSVQAQIINLLRELQQEQQLAMLFIAHDLAVVRHLSHRVMVMYLGRVMEQADAETLFAQPRHPYTRALMAAIPDVNQSADDEGFRGLRGDLPSAANPPPGCVFASRCPMAEAECTRRVPALNRTGPGAAAACHFVAGAALAA